MQSLTFAHGLIIGAAAALGMVVGAMLGFLLIRPWIRMKLVGGQISLFHVLGMRLRGTPPMLIVDAYATLLHRGEPVRLAEVESQYVAFRDEIDDARDLVERVSMSAASGKAGKVK